MSIRYGCTQHILCIIRNKLQSVLYRTHQTAGSDDILNKRRERLRLIALAGGDIGNHAGIKIHLDLVAVFDVLGGLFTFENSKTDVEGVAVKNSGEGGGNHAGNARSLNGDRRVLTGRTAAEILASHHNFAGLYLPDKIGVYVLHAVSRQLRMGRCIEITCGNDDVGVNIVAVFMNSALCLHFL
jgi:hypothetical protein